MTSHKRIAVMVYLIFVQSTECLLVL